MIYFFDSSALVKRYINEPGREKVNLLIGSASLVAVSRLAYPEILSALTRRRSTLNLTDKEFVILIEAFKTDWEQLAIFDMDNETMQYVDGVISQHHLRGADSIHLSTAIWLKKHINAEITFVTSDRELLSAARKERHQTLDPQEFPTPHLAKLS